MKRILFLLAIFISLYACSDDEKKTDPVHVDTITIDKSVITLSVDSTAILHYQEYPGGAIEKGGYTWSIEEEKYATIDSCKERRVYIKGKQEGQTVLKIIGNDNKKLTSSCIITVVP